MTKPLRVKIKLKDVYSNDRNNDFWKYVRSIPEFTHYEQTINDILKTKNHAVGNKDKTSTK